MEDNPIASNHDRVSKMQTIDSILEAALALSEADRVKLIDGIAASLPADDAAPELARLHSSWRTEIDRRAKKIEDGTAEYVTWEEAKQYARSRVKKDA